MTNRERLKVTSIVYGYRGQDDIARHPTNDKLFVVWMRAQADIIIDSETGEVFVVANRGTVRKLASNELLVELDRKLLYWAGKIVNYLNSIFQDEVGYKPIP